MIVSIAEIEKRASGRTLRMIDHAIRLAKSGRTVYVVLYNGALCRMWERHVAHRVGEDRAGIKFETEDSLGDSLDWQHLRVRATPGDTVLLIDHAVIEVKFRNIFHMWQQYDSPRSFFGERMVNGIPARERLVDDLPGDPL